MSTSPVLPERPPARVGAAPLRARRERSTLGTMVHLLGSLKLAVILLATIAGSIAFATLMESKFDSKVAAYYIYNAAWFNVWLLGLGLNLLCAAFTRWPWKKRHIGFVTTHAGIILLLVGAVVGRLLGFEAFVTLDKTAPPESRLYLHDTILKIGLPNGEQGQIPLATDFHAPTEARPFQLPLAGTDLTLVIDRVSERLVPEEHLVAVPGGGAPGGVALRLINAGMGQEVAVHLRETEERRTHDFFGFARIELVPRLPETAPLALPAPAGAKPAPPRDETPFHESQVVFLDAAQPSVLAFSGDVASGYQARLERASGPDGWQITLVSPVGQRRTWPLAELRRGWQAVAGEGDPLQVTVREFWPEFAMKAGRPVSLSTVPRHPAALVELNGPSRLLPPPAPVPVPPLAKGLVLRVAPAKDPGRLVYESERAGRVVARAVVPVGESFRPGWSQWAVRVDAVLPHAELFQDVREAPEAVGNAPRFAASEGLRTGLRAHLRDDSGQRGPEVWIPGGTSREVLFDQSRFVRVGFGQKVVPLDFTIALEDFSVPRDEGTETPANFISHVRFDQAATGRTVRGVAEMNSPAMFPGETWRSLLGWNYKFSQANWDPQNLNVTTLQVLYDPGWPLKWIGSLAICAGIALMFYFMPKRSARERSGRGQT